jgi:hypothetical protein
MNRVRLSLTVFAVLAAAAACNRTPRRTTSNGVPLLAGVLVPASTTIGDGLGHPRKSYDGQVANTPVEAMAFTSCKMACANCHLNAGTLRAEGLACGDFTREAGGAKWHPTSLGVSYTRVDDVHR